MPSPIQKQTPRSIEPTGLTKIEGKYLDIFPVPEEVSMRTSRDRSYERIPISVDFGEYRSALLGERDFLAKEGKPAPELQERQDAQRMHEMFTKGGFGKIGLRNIHMNGTSITADHVVVPMPAYLRYSESENPKSREFGSILGAALIIVTADNKLILQHRSPKNRKYGDVPGVSVAGLVDATPDLPDELDLIAFCRAHLVKEAKEELGIDLSDPTKLQFTGILVDKDSLHHELQFTCHIPITAAELHEIGIAAKQARNGVDFGENWVAAPNEAETITALSEDCYSPTPRSHLGGLILHGGTLTREVQREVNAQSWMRERLEGSDRAFSNIQKLTLSGRYTPSKSATDQGLPSFVDELKRLFPDGDYFYSARSWDPLEL